MNLDSEKKINGCFNVRSQNQCIRLVPVDLENH